jgi:cytochrome c oxidase assembly factor CtaG
VLHGLPALLAHGGGHVLPGLTSWTWDPFQLVPTALAAYLYYRRCQSLARRGTPVPAWRRWMFGTGIAIAFLAFASPVHVLGERDFFFFHMLQHVLLGDLAPLFLVAGLTGPVLRPVLALPVVERLRILAHPLVALPLWALNLYLWHLPVLYEAALHHDSLHALQHALFFVGGCLMWMPVFETLPEPEWFGTGAKLGYVALVRLIELPLGNLFFWSGSSFYSTYRHGSDLWALSPVQDQGYAGAVMMGEGSLVTLIALAWLFLRLAQESELRQQLLERGLDPRAVLRAVRYGRAHDLAQPR